MHFHISCILICFQHNTFSTQIFEVVRTSHRPLIYLSWAFFPLTVFFFSFVSGFLRQQFPRRISIDRAALLLRVSNFNRLHTCPFFLPADSMSLSPSPRLDVSRTCPFLLHQDQIGCQMPNDECLHDLFI